MFRPLLGNNYDIIFQCRSHHEYQLIILIAVFWLLIPCWCLSRHRLFGEECCLHF